MWVMGSKTAVVAGTVGLVAVILAVALSRRSAQPPSMFTVAGSSTVAPLIETAISAYRADPAARGSRIDLMITGTTAGMRAFCSGAVPIANASRPISREELGTCASSGVTFIELPIAFDALTVVVNPSNSWVPSITPQQLSTIWSRNAQAKVMRWNQVDPAWADRPLRLCGPGADSGTFDYFNEAINGAADNSRTDYDSSEDDQVLARCVADDPDAMGYFGFSHYSANATVLRALAIDGPFGAVDPSVTSVQEGKYMPLSRPLFLYINATAAREDAAVRKFVSFVVRDGLRFTEQAGMIPLPASTYRLAEAKFHRGVPGSAFAGDLPVGLTIGEALRRSFDQIKRPEFR